MSRKTYGQMGSTFKAVLFFGIIGAIIIGFIIDGERDKAWCQEQGGTYMSREGVCLEDHTTINLDR